jgi:hypothetical protein
MEIRVNSLELITAFEPTLDKLCHRLLDMSREVLHDRIIKTTNPIADV